MIGLVLDPAGADAILKFPYPKRCSALSAAKGEKHARSREAAVPEIFA
jgi:hypothetical protein